METLSELARLSLSNVANMFPALRDTWIIGARGFPSRRGAWGWSLATHASHFGVQVAETTLALPDLIFCLTASFSFGMLSQCILSGGRCKV